MASVYDQHARTYGGPHVMDLVSCDFAMLPGFYGMYTSMPRVVRALESFFK